MSNAILVNTTFKIPNSMIDVARFKELINKAISIPDTGKWQDFGGDSNLYHAWWFLTNHKIDDQSVKFFPTYVEITLGRGRSTHTNRDLRGTIRTIQQYIKPGLGFSHKFMIRDEFDDFVKKHSMVAIFSNSPERSHVQFGSDMANFIRTV